jgi:hypothetical protein
MKAIQGRVNRFTPKGTRYVCVGAYKFKGVSKPQTVYAVGESIESLQPPKGGDKVKRLGGPKYVRSRARDRKILEWVSWFIYRLGFIAVIYWACIIYAVLSTQLGREFMGMPYMSWLEDVNEFLVRAFKWAFLGE